MFKLLTKKNTKFVTLFLTLVIVLTPLTSMTPATTLANADIVEVVTNGSFETGFTGWTAQATTGVWRPWQVSGAGVGGFPPFIAQTSPQDGSLVAWNGFTTSTPGEFRLWQDVTIPAGVATLSWKDRIQKDFWFSGIDPYTYEVQIRDPDTNNVISVYDYSIDPVEGTQYDTGWQSHSVDVSRFASSTVTIYFVEYISYGALGPGQVEIDAVSLLVDPNQPPIADAGPDRIVEANTAGGANVVLDGSGSSDTDNDPLTYIWTWDSETASGVNPTIFLPVGTTTVMLVVNDGTVDSESDTVDITVETNQPPDVSQAYASIDCIWPPNHKMVDISIMGVTDSDNDPITITIIGITSDEPVASGEGSGGKNHAPDADGIGTDIASVRAEREAEGDGRVYVISFTADDGAGGVTEGSVKVGVPHDKSNQDCPAIDSGQYYDATLNNKQ